MHARKARHSPSHFMPLLWVRGSSQKSGVGRRKDASTYAWLTHCIDLENGELAVLLHMSMNCFSIMWLEYQLYLFYVNCRIPI